MTTVRRRAAGLFVVVFIAIFAVSCGRASTEQINQALGITPTATQNPTLVAQQTAQANLLATQQASSSPGASPSGQVALVGNPTLGRTPYQFRCAQCHSAAGPGPNLTQLGGPGKGMTYEKLYPIVREGKNHPPGPMQTFQITDQNIADIAAFIAQQAGP
jgi:mono/diheme cytochrome c family protein